MLLPYGIAHGATWQWTALAGRERLTIQLDAGEREQSLKRTGTHSLTMGLNSPTPQLALQGAGPGVANLVSNAQARGNAIELSLHNPAFGYVVTRPSAGQIVIDIFPDPLGARWTPSGQLGPASLAASVPSPPAPAPVTPSPVSPAGAKPAPAARSEQTRGLALTPPQSEVSVGTSGIPRAAASAKSPANPPVAPRMAEIPQEQDDPHGPAVEDSALPEMPASGALRAQDAASDAPQTAQAGASAAVPTSTAESAGRFLTDMVKGVLSLKAYAAGEGTASAPSEGGRARILSPQNIRASVNSDGPEAWGSEDSLSTALPVAAGAAMPSPLSTTAPKPASPAPVPAPASTPTAVQGSPASTNEAAKPAQQGQQLSQPPLPPASPSITQPAAKGEIRQAIVAPGVGPNGPQTSPVTTAMPSATATPSTMTTPATPSAMTTPSTAASTTTPSTPSATTTPSSPASTAGAATTRPSTPPTAATPATATAPAAESDSQPQVMNQTRQAASGPKGGNATAVQDNATRPVVYVNEKGEVVPKPPEPDKMLAEAESFMDKTQYAEALPILRELKDMPLAPAQHEKILYHIMDATASLYAGKALEGFEPIVAAASEAMNANLRSSRVPDALFRLGMINLDVGNLAEAEGYFKAFKRRHPYDMNVPLAFKHLGLAQLAAGKNAQAVQSLQMIVQEYPETSILRDAAVGLARALYAEGSLDKMAIITDFIDKRWPRYYVQDPDYLLLLADSETRLNRLEEALQHYWLYYNLVPGKPDNDKIFARIGDLYLRTGRLAAAKELFEEIRIRYPKSDGAALALLRLAEQGIHDSPVTIDEMFRVFVLAGEPKPPVAYKELQRDYPKDPRSILSGLKLAMWQLWNKEYTDAMGAAADFIDLYPDHPDVEQARQIIMRAFAEELKNALAEENYGRILILWNGFPLVRERYGDLDANMRHALARGYIERGDDEKALEMLSEFLRSPKHPVYSDYTFTLFFNKYLQAGDWNALLDLGELVKDWPMQADMRSQLDYALALSAENLGLAAKALPLWQQLAARKDIPLYEQAYATYFLAKDAERRRDIKEAYKHNVATLDLFQRLQDERSDRADPDRIKEAIGSLMDITEVGNHIPEALEWVERYNQFAPEDSPEYPGLRFREARLYRKLGDANKAKSLLEQVVAKAPDSAFGKAAAMELRTFEVSRDLRNLLQDGK